MREKHGSVPLPSTSTRSTSGAPRGAADPRPDLARRPRLGYFGVMTSGSTSTCCRRAAAAEWQIVMLGPGSRSTPPPPRLPNSTPGHEGLRRPAAYLGMGRRPQAFARNESTRFITPPDPDTGRRRRWCRPRSATWCANTATRLVGSRACRRACDVGASSRRRSAPWHSAATQRSAKPGCKERRAPGARLLEPHLAARSDLLDSVWRHARHG